MRIRITPVMRRWAWPLLALLLVGSVQALDLNPPTSAGVTEATNIAFTAAGATLAPSTPLIPRLRGCDADATFVADFTDGVLAPECTRGSAPVLTGNYEWVTTSLGAGLHLKNASGYGKLCIAAPKTMWRLGDDWSVRLIVQPNTWSASSTLIGVTSGWDLYTASSGLRFLVKKSPQGSSGYNRQWFLGVQGRLGGGPHVLDLIHTTRGGHREAWVLTDGELRAQILDEVLSQPPGNTGTLCVGGGTWDLTIFGLEIHNGTHSRNQSTYTSPLTRSIYPGRLQLDPLPLAPGQSVIVDAEVDEPGPGTRIYLEPRYLVGTELTKPITRPVSSFVQMACGVSSSRNHTFADVGAQSFRRHNATFSCVISNAGFNKTATDALATWGVDLGLEWAPTDCGGVANARQSWLINRGHYPYSFVNYFGISAESGLQCIARYGLYFLAGPDTNNAHFFRTTMRHSACDYKSDPLACFIKEVKKAQQTGTWTIMSSHWGSKANDTLYEDLLQEAERLGIRFESVREVQRARFPDMGHGSVTLTPPPGATALVPTLYLYSDGTATPTLRRLVIRAVGNASCTPAWSCSPWGSWSDAARQCGTRSRLCEDAAGCLPDRTETETHPCPAICVDADGDGYSPGTQPGCPNGDCDDSNAQIRPGIPENCATTVDDNCNGLVNENCSTPCTDADGDGYSPGTQTGCVNGDCNDNAATIHPGAPESCSNTIDDDCDGVVNENCTGTCVDADGDGYVPTDGCNTRPVDCDDTDFFIAPGRSERCNNRDDNCDGRIDHIIGSRCVNGCTIGSRSCEAGIWSSCVNVVNPSTEVCDGRDNNYNCYLDDGFATICDRNGVPLTTCIPATEVCNGYDDDCDRWLDNAIAPRTCTLPDGSAGTQTCLVGFWTDCTSARTAGVPRGIPWMVIVLLAALIAWAPHRRTRP